MSKLYTPEPSVRRDSEPDEYYIVEFHEAGIKKTVASREMK